MNIIIDLRSTVLPNEFRIANSQQNSLIKCCQTSSVQASLSTIRFQHNLITAVNGEQHRNNVKQALSILPIPHHQELVIGNDNDTA